MQIGVLAVHHLSRRQREHPFQSRRQYRRSRIQKPDRSVFPSGNARRHEDPRVFHKKDPGKITTYSQKSNAESSLHYFFIKIDKCFKRRRSPLVPVYQELCPHFYGTVIDIQRFQAAGLDMVLKYEIGKERN